MPDQLSWYIKQGDTAPAITAQINNDLTGATVQFVMATTQGVVLVNQPAVILDNLNGIVQYSWAAGDTNTPSPDGVGHKAEFQVTYPDTSQETYPNTGYIAVYIFPTLA